MHCGLDNKATDTHSEYVILLVLYGKVGYTNAPPYYIYTYIVSPVMNLTMEFN